MEPTPTDATIDPPTADPAAAPVVATQPVPTQLAVTPSTHPLAVAPPLSLVAALSGLLATLLVRVLIPSRDPDSSIVLWEIVARVGQFAVNLSALASMVALVLGLSPWLRGGAQVSGRQRLLIAAFGGMLLPVWLRAVFFSRESMNGALASIGAATACTLSTMLVVGAIRGARARPLQLLPVVLVTLAALCSLALLTLQSIAILAPFSQVHRLNWLVSDMGEAAYLGVMLCAVTLLPARPWNLRQTFALGVGGATTLAVAVAFWVAHVTFGRDFAVALYYAQRVTWFLDGALWVYAIALAIGIGGAMVGLFGSDPLRRQLGVAVLAWISAGFAPRAPWRFMLLALAACLIARVVSAHRDPEST